VWSVISRGLPRPFFCGASLIQIPTTLLAQVDSAWEARPGVNTAEGKNLLGTFSQPSLVIADVDTLRSLEQREYKEGFAEIIKHAAIQDAAMFDPIHALADGQGSHTELHPPQRRHQGAQLWNRTNMKRPAWRALLNFGHTIGHAIEASAGYARCCMARRSPWYGGGGAALFTNCRSSASRGLPRSFLH